MGIFRQFPYSNFHDMNMDQIIKIMREMQDEWDATKAEWASYKDFIDNYFSTLDLSEEVLQVIRRMAADGSLNEVMDPVIIDTTNQWLADHITATQGETVIDKSLTIAGAAADAKAAGDFSRDLKKILYYTDDRSFKLNNLKIYTTVNNYALTDDGLTVVNNSCKLVKYPVYVGQLLKINSLLKFQFQNGINTPAAAPSPRIGNTYGEGVFYMQAPAGATHLILSVPINSTAVVKSLSGAFSEIAFNFTGNYADTLHNLDSEINTNYEIGTIDTDTNVNNNHVNNRLRSDFMASPSTIITADIPDTMDWFVIEYDEHLNIIGTSPTWVGTSFYRLRGAFFRIILRYKDNSTINTQDANNFHVYAQHTSLNAVRMIPDIIVEGYELYGNENGICRTNSDYSLWKYDISKCKKISLVSNAYWQFQNTTYVPGEGVNHGVVGPIHEPTSGEIVDVPDGATWLILSIKNEFDTTGLYQKDNIGNFDISNLTYSPSPVLLTEKYIGHRGGGKSAPENTIPGFAQGYDNGFKIFEFDIQFTSDNVPVLLHDTTINRTGRNADGTEIATQINISDITFAQAQTYDFGIWKGSQYAGTVIPSLAEALIWLKKRGLCGEMDCYGTQNFSQEKAQIIYDIVKEAGMQGSIVFTSEIPKVEAYIACGNDVCVCMSTTAYNAAQAQTAAAVAKKAMYATCSQMYPTISADSVKTAHAYGLKVKGFTINSNAVVNTLLDYSTDQMILDGIYPTEIILS